MQSHQPGPIWGHYKELKTWFSHDVLLEDFILKSTKRSCPVNVWQFPCCDRWPSSPVSHNALTTHWFRLWNLNIWTMTDVPVRGAPSIPRTHQISAVRPGRDWAVNDLMYRKAWAPRVPELWACVELEVGGARVGSNSSCRKQDASRGSEGAEGNQCFFSLRTFWKLLTRRKAKLHFHFKECGYWKILDSFKLQSFAY